ncbi:hypothetical protein B0A55_11187 [Friedmanniomyces simplex]|uniref:MJ1316 RNA cyclic group end recognition domain-containing protein n=1 Tax=Friedmanniomyces simplex TaxID=329884 RepID=A0A4U0WNA4_9PEZI|nr:hypothetical protein B0A55_11187 [Friedmanniomyces simplex]
MAAPPTRDIDLPSMIANLHTLSLALHAHYIHFLHQGWATSAPRNMRPQRYIFPTSTIALGLWEPGEDVHLVCMTEDRKTTFWDIVTDEMHLEGEPGWALTDSTMTLDWPLLGLTGNRASKLAGTALYLHYALLPPPFSLDLLPQYGIPEYRRRDTVAYMPKHVDLVRHALHLTTALQTPPLAAFPFVPTYRRLRRWIYAMGLLAPKLGLLDGKTLLNLIFGACQGYVFAELEQNSLGFIPSHARFLDAFFLKSWTWFPAYREAVGANPHGATAMLQALKWTCGKVIEKGGPGGARMGDLELDRITPATGFKGFLDWSDFFLLVSVECWGSAESMWRFFHIRFENLVKQLAIRLHEVVEGRECVARAWPFLVPCESGVSCVLGLTRRLPAEEVKELTVWLRSCYDGEAEQASMTLRRQPKAKIKIFGKVMECPEEVVMEPMRAGIDLVGGTKGAEMRSAGSPGVGGKVVMTRSVPAAGPSLPRIDEDEGEESETETPKKGGKKKRRQKKKKPPKDHPLRAADVEESGPFITRANAIQGPAPRGDTTQESKDAMRRNDSIPDLDHASPQTNTNDLSMERLTLNDSTDDADAPIPEHPKKQKKKKRKKPKPPKASTPPDPSTRPDPSTPPNPAAHPSTHPTQDQESPPHAYLRPLPQILSRLRWDPAHRSIAYEIGYRDRFLPELLWMPLEQWGRTRATEAEDFVPEHRVQVVRRVGGNENGEEGVVWDRRGGGWDGTWMRTGTGMGMGMGMGGVG